MVSSLLMTPTPGQILGGCTFFLRWLCTYLSCAPCHFQHNGNFLLSPSGGAYVNLGWWSIGAELVAIRPHTPYPNIMCWPCNELLPFAPLHARHRYCAGLKEPPQCPDLCYDVPSCRYGQLQALAGTYEFSADILYSYEKLAFSCGNGAYYDSIIPCLSDIAAKEPLIGGVSRLERKVPHPYYPLDRR